MPAPLAAWTGQGLKCADVRELTKMVSRMLHKLVSHAWTLQPSWLLSLKLQAYQLQVRATPN